MFPVPVLSSASLSLFQLKPRLSDRFSHQWLAFRVRSEDEGHRSGDHQDSKDHRREVGPQVAPEVHDEGANGGAHLQKNSV